MAGNKRRLAGQVVLQQASRYLCNALNRTMNVRVKKYAASGPACVLVLITAVASGVFCAHAHLTSGITHSSRQKHLPRMTRSIQSTPTTSAVLDSSVVQPGAAAAAEAAAAQLAAAEVKELETQLSSFRLRTSDLNAAFLPKRVYPIERGTCGNWMDRYAQLHRDILQGRRPPRYSIFRQDRNGLTDRLVSSVSVFLHALLTDRAFLLDWSGRSSLWEAYRSSYIDWRYNTDSPPDKDAAPGSVLLLDFMGENRQGDHRGPEHAVYYNWFTDTQLQDVGSNATYLIWSVNRGLVWKAATNNIYIKQRLHSLGLNPVNIFGCLFDYLYRPTPSTMSLVTPLLPQLLDPSVFKVGLQIRTGDQHLGGQMKSKQFEEAFEWFHCAKVAEAHWKPPRQKSVWFLLTDSPDIRRGAKRYLGGQVVTMRDALVAHTLFIPNGMHHRSATVLGFAAAETWLFSLMDVHIISQLSGFGRMGAMISGNWDHIIQLFAGMWSLSGFEAKLTYLGQPEEGSSTNRTVVHAAECAHPSQQAGPAFCWPEDPPGPPPPMDGNSPMSLKIRHMCSKPTPMEDIVMAHTGARRN